MGKKKSSLLHRKYTVHKKLEQPVHNLIGYSTLFVFMLVVLWVIYYLKSFS